MLSLAIGWPFFDNMGALMNRQSELVSKLIKPLSELDTETFPAKQVILAALTWPTDGWMRDALSWLEQGVQLDEEIATALESVAARKSNGQSIRHQAFALAKRWRREHQ
jgi:hypothetical protein